MLRWKAHRGKIASLSFSRDGRTLASVTGTGRDVFLWDATSGELVRKLAVEDEPGKPDYGAASEVCFAPEADFLAVARKNWVEVWDAERWVRIGQADFAQRLPGEVKLGPGPRPRVAASTSDFTLLFDLPATTGGLGALVPVSEWEPNHHTRISFAPDGATVVTHTTRDVEVRDIASGTLVRQLEHPRGNYGGPVRHSPDGSRIAFAYTKTIESWPTTLDDPAAVVRYAGHTNKVWAIRYTPDGRSLISASSDGTVRVWDAAAGAALRCFEFGLGKTVAADVSPAGTVAAVGGATGEIVAWDLD